MPGPRAIRLSAGAGRRLWLEGLRAAEYVGNFGPSTPAGAFGPWRRPCAFTIVIRPLAIVGQDRVGSAYCLELLRDLLILRMMIGVQLEGQLPIGRPDLRKSSRRGHSQGLVVVLLLFDGMIIPEPDDASTAFHHFLSDRSFFACLSAFDQIPMHSSCFTRRSTGIDIGPTHFLVAGSNRQKVP